MTGPTVRYGEREIAHEELRAQAARTATGLVEAGVRHGDRVALVLRNEPTFLSLSAACGLIGAVPVPVNWHWHGPELRHVIAHSGSRVVFAHSDFVANVEEILPDGVPLVEVPVPQELTAHYGPAPLSGRRPLFADWIGAHDPYAEPLDAAPMSVIYTSGTTGLPKGVIRDAMTPEQSRDVAAATLRAMGLAPEMHTLVTAPMYHSAPNAQALFALALGIELTIMPRFTPEHFLALVQEQAVTHAQTVPTMFVRLLELPGEIRSRYDLSSLECVVHAAAPCPAHVKRRIIDWFGPVIREYYGATEIGVVIVCDSDEWLAHEGTVGHPFGGSDIHVHDGDGRLLDVGETGEIFIRPPDYWPGFTYLGQDDKRREIERDGYISIGDVGHVDADGYLYLSDRARDMVISGGVNIYPAEIEACLLALAGVRDVAVFGIPDDSFGEALAVHVDAEPSAGLTEDAVREHVGSQLAAYKVPQVVVFDDELPREESGKIFKRRLRDRYWEQAGRRI
ncbi:MAG TPA: AMP-binding protein [Solirubrobacteraceae bacterium]|jgi:long-chain acyl-CoA synthetase